MAEKSQNLAIAIEGEPQNLDQVVQDAKTAVEKATESIKKDPLLTKDVALEVMKNRAYLNIVGREDLKEANEEFYNTTFKAIYEGVTVPEDQKEELDSINESYTKGEIAPIMAVELALKVLSNSGK